MSLLQFFIHNFYLTVNAKHRKKLSIIERSKTMLRWGKYILTISFIIMFSNLTIQPTKATTHNFKVPGSVMNISKENTYPNPDQNIPSLQPGSFAKKLIESSNVKIDNQVLIRMLNESSVSNAPLAIGYRAKIFLGLWPLNYESKETAVNWQYQKVNTNLLDNRGEIAYNRLMFFQNTQRIIRGGLTSKIRDADDVKSMMMKKAMEKTQLPLAFHTVIGPGTKSERVYNVPPKQIGYLYAYCPAVNEKGKITFGEVYLILKGNKRSLLVKNVISQGIGAWIPVQDHLSLGYLATSHPR